MHRQVDPSAVLLVEGPSDLLVLRPLVDGVSIFVANTKSNVYRAVSALKLWDIPGVRGVVDSDFDEDEEVSGIVPWDGRDLENMLVGIGVLASVIDHQGSEIKIGKLGGSSLLVTSLIESLSEVTRLRFINSRDSLGLPFDDVDIASKVNQKNLKFDITGYVTALLSKVGYPVTVGCLIDKIRSEIDDQLGPRGKDIVALAGVALRSRAGNLKAHACEEPVLSSQLRSSASFALDKSEWFTKLRVDLHVARNEVGAKQVS
jgi:hypothetical protein